MSRRKQICAGISRSDESRSAISSVKRALLAPLPAAGAATVFAAAADARPAPDAGDITGVAAARGCNGAGAAASECDIKRGPADGSAAPATFNARTAELARA
jgi:hypothetical protein